MSREYVMSLSNVSVENCGLIYSSELHFLAFSIKIELWGEKPRAPSLFYPPLSRTPTNLPHSLHPLPPKKVILLWTFSPFQGALHTKAGPVPNPPIYKLSGEKLSRKGIYLMDTGHVSTTHKTQGVLLVTIFSFEWRRTSYSRWSYYD